MVIRRTRFHFASIGLLIFFLFSAPAKGRALEMGTQSLELGGQSLELGGQSLEMGMTPSHVYEIWLNINTVFVELQRANFPNPDVIAEIETMQPLVFEGKVPGHVLSQAKTIKNKFVEVFDVDIVTSVPKWLKNYQNFEKKSVKEGTTPSEVFVMSSQFLSLMVSKYVEVTKGTRPISQFFDDHEISDKMPSDVFGLVDLLGRRLEKSLSRRETSPSIDKEDR